MWVSQGLSQDPDNSGCRVLSTVLCCQQSLCLGPAWVLSSPDPYHSPCRGCLLCPPLLNSHSAPLDSCPCLCQCHHVLITIAFHCVLRPGRQASLFPPSLSFRGSLLFANIETYISVITVRKTYSQAMEQYHVECGVTNVVDPTWLWLFTQKQQFSSNSMRSESSGNWALGMLSFCSAKN